MRKTRSDDEIAAIKSNIRTAFAMLSTQSFLLEQWYGQWFLRDPAARVGVPDKLIRAARYDATGSGDSDDLMQIQQQVIEHMERFFASVERRLEETEAARGVSTNR
ncbi:hypothetical protein [Burkholderia ubonensis]|uniref:hypothetical protein n=1 Tax=Burkholderia ubonensis TaxID=101571 RepID=UPI00075F5234|nr:hypothetical protein [Burkholderia ubonensis]